MKLKDVREQDAQPLWDAADLLRKKAKELEVEAHRLLAEASQLDRRAGEIVDGAL